MSRRLISHSEITTAYECQAKDSHIQQVRERRAAGESVDVLAAEFGVHRTTIYHWLRQTHAPTYTRRGAPFWDRVDQRGPDQCWPWLAGGHPNGYGQIVVDGHKVYAHRHAYELVHGPVPAGLLIRHTCDYPPCCNPAHLIPGTHAQNAQDAVERGRNHRPAGEVHGQSKFTDDLIARARALGASGLSNLEVAAATGISRSYVSRLLRGTRR